MYKSVKIIVKGRVQGVGFRPFVYSLAMKHQLNGIVQNNLDRVTIMVEGISLHVDQMLTELRGHPPKLAKLDEVDVHHVPWCGYKDFSIIPSEGEGGSVPWMPSDAAVCKDCLEEMKNPLDRRFQYPFINCTQCGPRYTIIDRLPYDRPMTTMKEFAMCHDCRSEYDNLLNRRHHAQPICCPKCGPAVTLLNNKKEILAESQSAITRAVRLIKQGKILAIKGLGGYHLACDAYQADAVEQIRMRKRRPQRPLAVMVKSLEAAKTLCHISKLEEEMLSSTEMPIVILQKKRDCILPETISPGLSTLGIMLPYTPLHHLLFDDNSLECLIMTSANPSGLPILYSDGCIDQLKEMSDFVLTHNRDIHFPVDDSVVQVDGESTIFLRRARGFVPEPMKTTSNTDGIIALGGNQKTTFAVGKGNHFVMSPHIGDLDNEEMITSLEEQLLHFKKWMGVEEEYVAVDKHPLFASGNIAKKLKRNVISVQHHHAHHVSCMEDNSLIDPCLGIILDGTGYGDDGHIWGFECLYGDAGSFERLGHLQYTPLPGGERAVKEPWRNAVGMLLHHWQKKGKGLAAQLFPERLHEINVMEQMVDRQMNSPMAGTCGRLFDAVSAILGICHISTYEGEAAIKLSDCMNQISLESTDALYSFHIKADSNNLLELDFSSMLLQILQDKKSKKPITDIIHTFHRTLVAACVDMVLTAVKNRPDLNRTVVLSGGSFQNIFLLQEIQKRLQHKGFSVFTHNNIPCHDGGLSAGQLIIASKAVATKEENRKGGQSLVPRGAS